MHPQRSPIDPWAKSRVLCTGQTPVTTYHRGLMMVILHDRIHIATAEQGKLGGGPTWGWYSYDPKLNLVTTAVATPARGIPRNAPVTTNGR